MSAKEKKTDYLVLLNAENRMPEDFLDTAEIIPVRNGEGEAHTMEKETYEAFMRLREDLMKNDGVQTEFFSVMRTLEEQAKIFEKQTKRYGLDFANRYVAKVGHSEHHTGICMDISIKTDGKLPTLVEDLLELEDVFKIIHAKLPEHGFILRYPKDKEASTGIAYEPWHIRYVGSPEIAKEITDNGLSLEEYCERL